MTKFILVGGYPHKATDGGKAFCEELVKDAPESVKFLDCLFARPEETWEKGHAQDKELFGSNLPEKQLDMVPADSAKFIEQLKWADVVYIRGGSNDALRAALEAQPGWIEALEGKTLAGSSAGANMLSKYFWSPDSLHCHDGLGVLPVKVIVHYGSDYNAPNVDWNKAELELKAYKEDLPILKLAEGQFEVMNI